MTQSDSIALFQDRARSVRAGIVLDESLVGRLCERLDGLPLAIELAAARVRSLALADIVARLSERLTLLRSRGRGTIERHRTMRATIEWSYRLLDDDERIMFCRLAVFAGSFSLDAAGAVATDGTVDVDRVVDLLDALTAKSMLVSEPADGQSRFRMLETLRQYAVEHLGAEKADAARRHAEYFASFLARHGGNHFYDDPAGNGKRLVVELDNIRAAISYAIGSENADLAFRLATRVMNLWFERQMPEPGRWIAQVADLAARSNHPRSAIAHGQAALAAAIRLDTATFDRHHEHGAGTWQYHWARAFMGYATDNELVDTMRRAVELARNDHPLWVCGTEASYIMHAARHGLPFQNEYEHFRANAERLLGRTGLATLAQIDAALALARSDRTSALALLDSAVAHSRAADLALVEFSVRIPLSTHRIRGRPTTRHDRRLSTTHRNRTPERSHLHARSAFTCCRAPRARR